MRGGDAGDAGADPGQGCFVAGRVLHLRLRKLREERHFHAHRQGPEGAGGDPRQLRLAGGHNPKSEPSVAVPIWRGWARERDSECPQGVPNQSGLCPDESRQTMSNWVLRRRLYCVRCSTRTRPPSRCCGSRGKRPKARAIAKRTITGLKPIYIFRCLNITLIFQRWV